MKILFKIRNTKIILFCKISKINILKITLAMYIQFEIIILN